MKKVLLIFFLFISLCIEAQTIRYTISNLNLRKEPTTLSKVITILPKGTPVSLAENCDCKWIPVYYDGNIGYVSSKYLTKSKPNNANDVRFKTNTRIRYYTNTWGVKVQTPTYYDRSPAGATALCRDGTYSFSRSKRGTCSHHGGVARWL